MITLMKKYNQYYETSILGMSDKTIKVQPAISDHLPEDNIAIIEN